MDKAVMLTGENIDRFRLLSLRSALKLEIAGMSRRGRSVYSIVKEEFGFKGSRVKVLAQLNDHIDTLDFLNTISPQG